jgi:hypothetical protein
MKKLRTVDRMNVTVRIGKQPNAKSREERAALARTKRGPTALVYRSAPVEHSGTLVRPAGTQPQAETPGQLDSKHKLWPPPHTALCRLWLALVRSQISSQPSANSAAASRANGSPPLATTHCDLAKCPQVEICLHTVFGAATLY